MTGLAMTFDDGPDPIWTPAFLDLLRDLGARATFFVIAPRAAAHPHLIGRMAAEGHAVGLHCDEHVRHSERDGDWIRADTRTALDRLRALGVRPTLWRAPWGVATAASRQIAAEHGLRLVGWTVDSHDWRGDSASAMFAATRERLRAAKVVLAHDGLGPGARRIGASETLAYVKLVAEHARRLELRLEALA